MKRIAIIGGGISGMAAAFFLEQRRLAGVPVEYVLFEGCERLGGVIRSERVGDCLVEAGPDSFLAEKTSASELCDEVGITGELIGSNDSQRKTYILLNGKLVSMPDGLAFMVPTKILPIAFSPLFSFGTKVAMMREWFYPRHEVDADESVGAFVERHYGREMVERIADPLLSGVYGGSADRLSLKAVLPRFAEMQARHGSLGKAMLKNRRQSRSEKPRPLFTTIKNGMQQLVDALAQRLPPPHVRLNAPVQSLNALEKGWIVSSPNSEHRGQQFDSVIVAAPAYQAAKLLQASLPDLAAELHAIQYSSSITISLGYDQAVRASLPAGFGFLVPRVEGLRTLAVTFVHNKFAHRVPEDQALIRCFLGGTRDEAALDLSEDELLRIVKKELQGILGITSDPLFFRIYKWKSAMAQYDVGHLSRLERIETLRRDVRGLFLAGNAYRGIGVPDCVRFGKQAARDALSVLGF
jgi:oxygen-dependent protoporphyrinogen oxidase